ncbi:hypothetical protein PSHT_16558 [Puccinia striiformis]|uniref:Uncharacterized protein n=1 Tax=Puccinia striiformis TaxID=27350 RepID=A0A2S4U9F1_9BASI|nr:hypothetical protein PSHT_16558 [Puccinia striiformis]
MVEEIWPTGIKDVMMSPILMKENGGRTIMASIPRTLTLRFPSLIPLVIKHFDDTNFVTV